MRGAVISAGSKSSLWVFEAMKKYFDEVDHLNIKNFEVHMGTKEPQVLYEGEPLRDYDCIYGRGSFRYADLLRAITTIKCKTCYIPVKASAFTIAHNKLLSQIKMDQFGIDSPKTYFAASTESARSVLSQMNFPIVMKFPQGTHGKGVMFADSFESATSMLDALTVLNQPILIQDFIETGGEDIRAIVVGDRVVGAMKRAAIQGEKRANIHAGGHGMPIELDGKATQICLATARAMECDIIAVDLLLGPKGYVVLESNLSPGLQGITAVTKKDLADVTARFLFEKTKERMEGSAQKGSKEIMKVVDGTDEKQIISEVDLRGNKILLPEIATKMSGFRAGQGIILSAKKGKLTLEEE